MRQGFFAFLAWGTLVCSARADGPELVGVEKIWDRAPHSAFTDLIRWRDRFYCVFRESEGHVGGDGIIRVLSSDDGRAWDSVASLSETGIDLRDPKLSITPDDRLMIVMGGSQYDGGKILKGRQPRVSFSGDGRAWTPPRPVLSEGEWLWRVTWNDGKAYGVSYGAPKDSEWPLKLFRSNDGVNYDLVTKLEVTGQPNETTLRFLPDGEMIALVRREAAADGVAWIGTSREPYRDWKWQPTKHRVGGPNFIRLHDGSLWAAGRSYPGGAKTVLARMTTDSYEPALTLPSGGDCSYPGLVWHDGLLWMSYYSSHEGKSAIYLARIRLPKGH
ncbi:MAG: sialidase family protein [Isosphaeraceae bacterium]